MPTVCPYPLPTRRTAADIHDCARLRSTLVPANRPRRTDERPRASYANAAQRQKTAWRYRRADLSALYRLPRAAQRSWHWSHASSATPRDGRRGGGIVADPMADSAKGKSPETTGRVSRVPKSPQAKWLLPDDRRLQHAASPTDKNRNFSPESSRPYAADHGRNGIAGRPVCRIRQTDDVRAGRHDTVGNRMTVFRLLFHPQAAEKPTTATPTLR